MSRAQSGTKWVGLVAGPVLAALTYALLPETFANTQGQFADFTQAGRVTAALAVWMATWWMTEAIPVYATALLPLAVLPVTGATSVKAASSPYGHELIFLFMGGFIIALSMQRWELHRRFAFSVLRLVGSEPRRLVGGFMVATAALSMWVSNTATTIMMLPIALSVIDFLRKSRGERGRAAAGARGEGVSDSFTVCLLLGIAYAASIGGIGTLIGTPPNLFLASYVKSELGVEISFIRWMGVGMPLVIVFLPVVWLLLTRVLFPIRDTDPGVGAYRVAGVYDVLGPMTRGERATFIVFVITALTWTFRPLLAKIEWAGTRPLAGLTDTGIAVIAALALFVIPVDIRRRTFVMDWTTAVKLPWGLLVLFGGGLSLAASIKANGVGEFIASRVSAVAGFHPVFLVVVVITMLVFLTELTSNTATTVTLVPIFASLAQGMGMHPYLLIVPTAIAASCAFMLPVATPPNAIVFGSGLVTVPQMAQAGLWLNVVGIALITVLTYAVAMPVLGVKSSVF
jgi:sodium-dependent dicarboxylate transporter 2/3/5